MKNKQWSSTTEFLPYASHCSICVKHTYLSYLWKRNWLDMRFSIDIKTTSEHQQQTLSHWFQTHNFFLNTDKNKVIVQIHKNWTSPCKSNGCPCCFRFTLVCIPRSLLRFSVICAFWHHQSLSKSHFLESSLKSRNTSPNPRSFLILPMRSPEALHPPPVCISRTANGHWTQLAELQVAPGGLWQQGTGRNAGLMDIWLKFLLPCIGNLDNKVCI